MNLLRVAYGMMTLKLDFSTVAQAATATTAVATAVVRHVNVCCVAVAAHWNCCGLLMFGGWEVV